MIAGDGRALGVFARINPIWFVVCFFAQGIAYLGYVVALRETAGVDGGPTLSYAAKTTVRRIRETLPEVDRELAKAA